MNVRIRFYRSLRAYLWSVTLHGCESLAIEENERKNIEVFEMWCYRKILKIKWTDKMNNNEVLDGIGWHPEMVSLMLEWMIRLLLAAIYVDDQYTISTNKSKVMIISIQEVNVGLILWFSCLLLWMNVCYLNRK